MDATYGNFVIHTDQPKDEGGDNSAPSPFDLFLASLGTCSGSYVFRFCQQRNIPPDKITLLLTIQRNMKTHMVENIKMNISVPPDFPERYKDALIRAAHLCTVKKHLDQPPHIDISVL